MGNTRQPAGVKRVKEFLAARAIGFEIRSSFAVADYPRSFKSWLRQIAPGTYQDQASAMVTKALDASQLTGLSRQLRFLTRTAVLSSGDAESTKPSNPWIQYFHICSKMIEGEYFGKCGGHHEYIDIYSHRSKIV